MVHVVEELWVVLFDPRLLKENDGIQKFLKINFFSSHSDSFQSVFLGN